MRVDHLLVARGLAASRSQAQRLVAEGVHWHDGQGWRRVAKCGDAVPEEAPLQLAQASESRYVSRGGLKLEGALAACAIDVAGRDCLDVGQSTGGFTDCLLQHGAAQVVGVDVGHGQLHPHLRADARVRCIEKVNARTLSSADLIAPKDRPMRTQGQYDAEMPAVPSFGLIVGDLSFISLTLVLPALVPLLKTDGALLMLVKPQFELQPGQIGKGGLVREPALYAQVEQRLRAACVTLGLQVRDWLDSPIAGGDGNREFFIHATL